MLANEDIRLGDMIDTTLCIVRKARKDKAKEDEVDWVELEHSSSDEAEIDFLKTGSRDPIRVPLAPCFVCRKADVGTRLTSC